jgi:hypothetical protein
MAHFNIRGSIEGSSENDWSAQKPPRDAGAV